MFVYIANIFGDMAILSLRAEGYCSRIPLLGDALQDYFRQGHDYFWGIRGGLYSIDDAWTDITRSISDILSWTDIDDRIRTTWSWIDDIPGDIRDFILEEIRTTWSWIDDLPGEIRAGAIDAIRDTWSWIDDIPGDINSLISDWFTDNFQSWIEDRAEDMLSLAGRVLDIVW